MTKIINLKVTKCLDCPYMYIEDHEKFCNNKIHKIIYNLDSISPDCPLPQDKAEEETELFEKVKFAINSKYPESNTTLHVAPDFDNSSERIFSFHYDRSLEYNTEFQHFINSIVESLYKKHYYNFYIIPWTNT